MSLLLISKVKFMSNAIRLIVLSSIYISIFLSNLNIVHADEQRCADGQIVFGIKTNGVLICESIIKVLLKADHVQLVRNINYMIKHADDTVIKDEYTSKPDT